jgi:hypothetical protein
VGRPSDFWSHGYIVFDDINWESFKHSAKSFCGGQRDFSVTDKYRRKFRLAGGIPSIILLNPEDYGNGFQDFYNTHWGQENITVIWINNKLY